MANFRQKRLFLSQFLNLSVAFFTGQTVKTPAAWIYERLKTYHKAATLSIYVSTYWQGLILTDLFQVV